MLTKSIRTGLREKLKRLSTRPHEVLNFKANLEEMTLNISRSMEDVNWIKSWAS